MTKPARDPRLDEPCQRPFDLVDKTTGEVLALRCSSRLNDDCPSCAVRYEIALKKVQEAGMPDLQRFTQTLALPAAAFVTLTLPSFGIIKNGAPEYPNAYRYGAQVLSSAMMPDLKRAMTERFRRATKQWKDAGMSVSFHGTFEAQKRGALHLHMVVVVDPGEPTWDGVTPPPTNEQLIEALGTLHQASTEVPQALRAHAASGTVARRRQQMRLPAPSKSTLRAPKTMTYGRQMKIDPLNVFAPASDPSSVRRKQGYVAKAVGSTAMTYTRKEVSSGAMSKATGQRTETHLWRLSREAFALMADPLTTRTVARWLDKRIAETTELWAETYRRLTARPVESPQRCAQYRQQLADIRHRLGKLLRAARTLSPATAWKYLDGATGKTLRGYIHPRRANKQAFARSIREQLGLEDVVPLDEFRFMMKHLALVLRRCVRFHGHTGTVVISSGWRATFASVKAAQRDWVIQQMLKSGALAFGPQPKPPQWKPLHEPRPWTDNH